jgi:hypothetical protein
MKKQPFFWLLVILGTFLIWLVFHKPRVQTPLPQQSVTNAVAAASQNTNQIQVSSVPSPNSPALNSLPVINAGNNPNLSKYPPDIVAKYRQGLISKDEAMQEILLAKNKNPQETYGKVIDQYGQPVVGANVTGHLVFEQGIDSDEKVKTYKTQTDENGLFQFTGLTGADLGVTVSKEGYLLGGHGEGYKAPVGGKSSPDNRVVLTMWKLHGSEPLVNQHIRAEIPCDGSTSTFDIMTGKKSDNGDLKITMFRFPLQLKPGLVHPYSWQFKVEMLQGALVEENDPYPYLASDSGYKSSFQFEISSNSIPWQNQFEQDFYIKTSKGQFGRMHLDVSSAFTPPRFQIDFTINPSGSKNLEPATPQ